MPTSQTDRQTGHTKQRSNSIGRTVLQNGRPKTGYGTVDKTQTWTGNKFSRKFTVRG